MKKDIHLDMPSWMADILDQKNGEEYFKEHRSNLDGGGIYLKYFFLNEIKKSNRSFSKCFEWCAGLGEIGLKLLQEGVIENLVLADINKVAIEKSIEITKKMGLSNKVKHYISDGLNDIPNTEKFDLVVGNPPNYFNIQKDHSLGKMFYADLRPLDKGWKVHKNFYDNISRYLTKDSLILIEEVELFKKEVFIVDRDIPYDIRPEEPILTFSNMIKENNLKILDIKLIHNFDGIECYFLKICEHKV